MNERSHIIVTTFSEFRGTYEHYKAKALCKHLREMADRADRAEVVRLCPKAPERGWLLLQEWVENTGIRRGQWISDVEMIPLP